MDFTERRGDRTRLTVALAFISGGLGALILLVFFASGGKPASEAGRIDLARADESTLASFLARERIGSWKTEEARSIADLLVMRATERGRIPERYLADFFPSAPETLAMLARDRDVDDYQENAEEEGAGGQYYQRVVELVPSMKALRDQYEGVFIGTFSALGNLGRLKDPQDYPSGASMYRGGVTLPGQSSKPMHNDLDLSHTYALDIFYRDVSRSALTGLECGPIILALEGGIVVAASSSWSGGEDLSSYHWGGIAPKAGNGVIVYSPRTRRYYLYFHLHSVFLKPGDAISAGQPLGQGGNTGTNARKPGHGEHLHLEVFDMGSGRFLKNTEILHLAFG